MKLEVHKGRKVTKPDFWKKFWFIQKLRNVHFWGVFWDFLGNYSNDFDKFASECRGQWYGTDVKNRRSKSFSVLEIFEDHPVSKLWDFVQILMLLGRMTSKRSGNHVSNVLNRLKVVGHDWRSSIKYCWAKTTYLWMIQDSNFRPYLAET